MTRRRTFSAALLAAGLATCLAGSLPAAAQPREPDRPTWVLTPPAHGRVTLSHVSPDAPTDMVFTCRRGEGAVHLRASLADEHGTTRVGERRATRLRLHSGAVSRVFAITSITNDYDVALPDLRIALSDPLMRAFAASHTIGYDRRERPASTPAERRAVDNLLRACAGR